MAGELPDSREFERPRPACGAALDGGGQGGAFQPLT